MRDDQDFTGVPLEDLAASIAEENFLMLREAKMDYNHSQVSAEIIKHLIKCILVDTTVRNIKGLKSAKERVQGSTKALTYTKTLIQEAVAEGFMITFKEYYGQELDYYCQIKPVPEPISRELN